MYQIICIFIYQIGFVVCQVDIPRRERLQGAQGSERFLVAAL